MISVVSGFVPIPGHPVSAAEYYERGSKLLDIKHRVMFTKEDVNGCWLYQYLLQNYPDDHAIQHAIADNPKKNTLAYHIVMAQKTEWLEAAAEMEPTADVFVWIDFGIFHVPGVTVEIIDEFLDRAESEKAIAIPGCWERDQYQYNDSWPYWRFCGGVMIVPRRYIASFNRAMKREYIRWLQETNSVSWEVNTLARLEQRDPDFPVWWYQADHNETLFTNYRATKSDENLH